MHVVVTGASSGIGAALAREFAAAGARLTMVARRRELLEKLAAEFGGENGAGHHHHYVVAHDLSDPARAADWLEGAECALGPVDVLVNNAGAQVVGPLEATDVDAGEAVLRLDLLAPLRITRAVLPGMLARRAGTVVDVASMAALAPTPGMTYYNAAKAGLAAASEALRGELRGTGVHVVTVYPGIIEDTDMARAALEKYASGMVARVPRATSGELARQVRRAVEKKRDRVIYPRSGALARWFPGTTRWMMDRFTPRPDGQAGARAH